MTKRKLIDADALLSGLYDEAPKDVALYIANFPEAQPERTGQWIPMFNGEFKGGAYWFQCSECGRIVPEVRNGGWNYCPNCGARMTGGDAQ